MKTRRFMHLRQKITTLDNGTTYRQYKQVIKIASLISLGLYLPMGPVLCFPLYISHNFYIVGACYLGGLSGIISFFQNEIQKGEN